MRPASLAGHLWCPAVQSWCDGVHSSPDISIFNYTRNTVKFPLTNNRRANILSKRLGDSNIAVYLMFFKRLWWRLHFFSKTIHSPKILPFSELKIFVDLQFYQYLRQPKYESISTPYCTHKIRVSINVFWLCVFIRFRLYGCCLYARTLNRCMCTYKMSSHPSLAVHHAIKFRNGLYEHNNFPQKPSRVVSCCFCCCFVCDHPRFKYNTAPYT